MKKNCFLFILFFLLAPFEKSTAVENFKPGIYGLDDRDLLLKDGHPWDAIGQVNISGYRRITRCTGTLIATNLVITAAHCLIDKSTNKHWPLNTIHFVAGVRGEQSKGHATAKCLKFIKGFKVFSERSKNGLNLKDLEKDAALIVLTHSLEIQPASLAESLVDSQELKLLHIGYPAERRFLPSAHRFCHLIKSEPNSTLWSTDCDTSPASSGGPLFQITQPEPLLAAIMIAAGKYNYALPLTAWKVLLFDQSCS